MQKTAPHCSADGNVGGNVKLDWIEISILNDVHISRGSVGFGSELFTTVEAFTLTSLIKSVCAKAIANVNSFLPRRQIFIWHTQSIRLLPLPLLPYVGSILYKVYIKPLHKSAGGEDNRSFPHKL